LEVFEIHSRRRGKKCGIQQGVDCVGEVSRRHLQNMSARKHREKEILYTSETNQGINFGLGKFREGGET
jgi:hypothetical protein